MRNETGSSREYEQIRNNQTNEEADGGLDTRDEISKSYEDRSREESLRGIRQAAERWEEVKNGEMEVDDNHE